MRFEVVQRHDLGPGDLVDALHDPAFLVHLGQLPDFGSPELLDHHDDGAVVTQRSRYRYDGPLPPAAGRFIDAARLSWVHESRFDRTTMTGAFTIHPDHYADRLRASGGEAVTPSTGGGSVRTVHGDLRVAVPLVAGRVERAIVDGLRSRLTEEVDALRSWLAGRPPPG